MILFIPVLLAAAHCGSCVQETTDPEHFKAVMEQIFIDALGEDLRRKIESISNEGVMLNKTSKEIESMAMARLNAEEKQRLKKAFEAIAGPARKFAGTKIKGAPRRKTRSSHFKPIPKRQRKPKGDASSNSEMKKNKNSKKNKDEL